MKFKIGDIVRVKYMDYGRIGKIIDIMPNLTFPYKLKIIDNEGKPNIENAFCDFELEKISKEEAFIEIL